jgi:hypothetical protein
MTLSGGCVMFAFPPKADITEHDHCAKSYQRHICFSRAPMGTVFGVATAGELLSRVGAGHAHCSK